MKRKPDFELQRYLRRWWLIPRNRWFNVYLHQFYGVRTEDLHDHPWWSVSIVLSGSYREFFHDGTSKVRGRGRVIFRTARLLHRIQVNGDAWTLFITGPRIRPWGFLKSAGWSAWGDAEGDG